jgi:hypothetical protein
LARKAHWSAPDQLFFSCPARTGPLARRYCIRSSDLSKLAKITAAKHGVAGKMAPKSFKMCGMNRRIITDGLNVEEAKLESRHTSNSAYNRYLLSMTGPSGVSSSRVAHRGSSRSTRPPPALSNNLIRLHNTGSSSQLPRPPILFKSATNQHNGKAITPSALTASANDHKTLQRGGGSLIQSQDSSRDCSLVLNMSEDEGDSIDSFDFDGHVPDMSDDDSIESPEESVIETDDESPK